ncbi:JAB domain-containing protein [Catalinimonas alkaloidigena]|uniref:JAB domain-containing protein n=1 Tax=Catalinimonas alkaloidigena TaxID=1075417 RepID=UPI002406EDAF|nr:JAB domain-containing protein [Catalinimonas alkaloidigena]
MADPKVIFAAALKVNSSAVSVAHNHPSGNHVPSKADIDLTRKLKQEEQFLDLPILDHLILSKESYYSFAATLERTRGFFSPFFLFAPTSIHIHVKLTLTL